MVLVHNLMGIIITIDNENLMFLTIQLPNGVNIYIINIYQNINTDLSLNAILMAQYEVLQKMSKENNSKKKTKSRKNKKDSLEGTLEETNGQK